MPAYKHRAPSTTSFSDDDDGYDDPVFSPAQWSTRKRLPAAASAPVGARSPIGTLPAEMVMQIFKHLHGLRDVYSALRVCRTWCECSVELLWHKPSLDAPQNLRRIARLLGASGPTFAYPTFVRRLNFATHTGLDDATFAAFAACDRLERLTLTNCDDLSAPLLTRVLPSYANLVALDASGVRNVTNDAVVGLAHSARRLQGINLTGCTQVSDKAVLALAAHCPFLRRIKLSNLAELTDTAICALARSCPLLLEIDLNHCELITDIAIRDIWSYATHMREIRLSHCALLTDAAFPAQRRDQPSDAPSPFPATLAAEELPPLILSRPLDHLRMLDLTACPQITDNALEGILSHAPKIRNLGLSKCTLLSDRTVEAICKLGRHLHYLHLGHADQITDRSVRTLARKCTRLRYVDFANCTQLTDMAVFELAALPKLRRVGLVRVNNLTDEAIYALAERHATLERIHLSYCDQISVMAVHFLLQKLHKLTHLSLTGVPAFRQTELQQFCRAPPADFSNTQQSAFCVYSGKGVSQLRAFLTVLFDRIAETNGTDDTDYEDEYDDPEAYDEDDTMDAEEPDYDDDDDQDHEYTAQRALRRTLPYRNETHYAYPRQPASYANNGESSTLTNLHGATDRLNEELLAASIAGPSRRPGRSMADILPIVENTSSPSNSDIVSRSNTIVASRYDSESGPYSGGVTSYADIGRGRGGTSSGAGDPLQLRRGHELYPHNRPEPSSSQIADDTARMVAVLSSLRTSESRSGSSRTDSSNSLPSGSTAVEGVAWPYQEPASPTMSAHAPPPPESSDGRGRNVKRSLRNTLNAAEHYASTLLFGRSPTREGSSSGQSRGFHHQA